MLELDIPGFRSLRLEHLVLDFNGTIACDGILLPGVAERLAELSEKLSIHVITADTFGSVAEQVEGIAAVNVLESDDHRNEKHNFIFELGRDATVALGNGRNDVMMLKAAAVGIAICQTEGGAAETLQAADVVSNDILDALDLLRNPRRMLATLRA